MNLDQLQKKLVSVARQNPPSDQVPYAFEKRIMAHLKSATADVWAIWGRGLWRAALACVVAVAALGIWSAQPTTKTDPDNMAEDFETAVFASFDQHVEDSW
jgi:anti-sigma-K factor RskA